MFGVLCFVLLGDDNLSVSMQEEYGSAEYVKKNRLSG